MSEPFGAAQSQRALETAEKQHPEWRHHLHAWGLLVPALSQSLGRSDAKGEGKGEGKGDAKDEGKGIGKGVASLNWKGGEASLRDLLIRPVQRVPRLKLLLEELLKQLHPNCIEMRPRGGPFHVFLRCASISMWV